MKIRMLETVRPDIPFFAKPTTLLCRGHVYEATSNPHGAICGICESGDTLGVRPGEFEFVEAPDWVQTIWREEYPPALASLGKLEQEDGSNADSEALKLQG